MDLRPAITARARELGFAEVGFVRLGPMTHAKHLDTWLAEGMHGEMAYMHKHRNLRVDARRPEPGMRSAIVVSAPYAPLEDDAGYDERIARYALGADYHEVLRARLGELASFVRAELGAEVATRAATDSAPLLERNLAVEAGIGWLGKSAMVLHQRRGSYFFIAELLVDVDLEPARAPLPDRCGRCTACIDACPTGAIVAPYRVDARRCIAYLTIELRGPIPRDLRPAIGHRLFGCDVCQSVCPWNRRADAPITPGLEPRQSTLSADAALFLQLSPRAFNQRFADTAIKRARRRGMARNAAVVLGNSGDRRWVGLLARTVLVHDEPLVRGHAAWALGRLGGAGATLALRIACHQEPDDYVREELRHALATLCHE